MSTVCEFLKEYNRLFDKFINEKKDCINNLLETCNLEKKQFREELNSTLLVEFTKNKNKCYLSSLRKQISDFNKKNKKLNLILLKEEDYMRIFDHNDL